MITNYNENEVVFIAITEENFLKAQVFGAFLVFYKTIKGDTHYKINISLLPNILKFQFFIDFKNEINYTLTYPFIEIVHRTDYLQIDIEAVISSSAVINCKNLGIDKTKNHSHYLIFDSSNISNLPRIETVENCFKNHSSFAKTDFLISAAFINSLTLLNNNSFDIDLHFVIINVNKFDTVAFKAVFNAAAGSTFAYYDIVYNPPGDFGSPL